MSSLPREPSLLQALTPLLFLAAALATAVYLFGDNASYGANQIALMLAGGVAALVGIRNGLSWRYIQDSLVEGISLELRPFLAREPRVPLRVQLHLQARADP